MWSFNAKNVNYLLPLLDLQNNKKQQFFKERTFLEVPYEKAENEPNLVRGIYSIYLLTQQHWKIAFLIQHTTFKSGFPKMFLPSMLFQTSSFKCPGVHCCPGAIILGLLKPHSGQEFHWMDPTVEDGNLKWPTSLMVKPLPTRPVVRIKPVQSQLLGIS